MPCRIIAIAVLSCWGSAVGAMAQNQPPIPPPPVISQIKKAVVFIQTDCQEEQGIKSYSGTGFFIFLPDSRLGDDQGFVYLITNRHVVQPGIEDNKPCKVAGYSIRFNLKAQSKDQKPGSQLLSIGEGKGLWRFPTDESVDLAAAGMVPDLNRFDVAWIPTNVMVDRNPTNVIEGDSVLFAGLFIQYMGQSRMQPIVRTGSLAMLPDELVQTTLKKMGRAILAEVHAFAGNSGSPMFIDMGGVRKGSLGYDFKLLGVVSGEVFETSNLQLQVVTSIKGDVAANSGIAMVVPAEELKTFLDSPLLKKERDDQVEAAAAAKNKQKTP